ncbi:YihY/virulence factor BrkB family protein [Brachybacterium sp. MASK1Z-5]|uniref:YihY/virulence factor BrkB family protein n=1 Tax=Brachybacterium halotolerans TaxID=2795215 RepID=A0ABS1BCF0_9MICO|nr:YihY/virulence factor BrkB family protein [Brachybacterium halotolerans]MBK0332212.1 YihY/virulence factor BrkB family protein [Brachybacterium halotolerans]
MAENPSGTADDEKVRLKRPAIMYMIKRVLSEFGRDGGTDQAAKLTYFMVLSIAPMLLAVFSLAALVLSSIKDQIAKLVTDAVMSSGLGSHLGDSKTLKTLVSTTLDSLTGKASGGIIALVIGIAVALWSASAYVKAFSRVANRIYEIPEGRNPVRFTLGMLAVTAGLVIGLLVIGISFMLNATIAESLLRPIAEPLHMTGFVEFLVTSFLPIWAWLKWPVIVVLMFVLVSVLYWAAPNIAKPFRLISPGGVFAIIGIAVAAVVLSIYMSTFASYSSYGAIGGVMAILFALWVMNIVIILGAEVDAEYERAKELQAGLPAENGFEVPMRGEKGAEKKEAKYEKVVDAGRDLRLQNLHRDQDSYTGENARIVPRNPTGAIPAQGDEDTDYPTAAGDGGENHEDPSGSSAADDGADR